MRCLAVAAVTFVLLAASPAPSSSPVAPTLELARSRVDTMLRTGHTDTAWFAASFLSQVSASQVDAAIASVLKVLGPYQSVQVTPEKFVAHFAKGTDDVLIHLDADGKIDGLFFRPPSLTASSLEEALRPLAQLHGTLSYAIVQSDGPEIAALSASEPLAVGSAFKLAVLNALVDQIQSKKRHWTDVVPLQERWKSLPTGVLQAWPPGTPLTIATYAAEMISISDNTAADALVRIVGWAALRRYAGSNDPFLTTREMCILKSSEGDELRAAYLASKTAQRRAAVLRRVDALPLPAATQLMASPEPAIEWHYSVRRLCGMMRRVAWLPLMSINHGVAERSAFRRVAYKGGSDTGVINMTTMVTTRRGSELCFSATLNDSSKDVDDQGFELAYGAALRTLASR